MTEEDVRLRDAQDAAVADFYDDLSRYYHLMHEDWQSWAEQDSAMVDGLIRASLPAFRAPEETRVLDCAAGIGTQAIGLHRRGYRITACDASEQALATLQDYLKSGPGGDGGRPLPSRKADFRKLEESLPGEQFDVVVCMANGLAHMQTPEDLQAAVASMAGMLAPGGVLLISVRPYDELLEERPVMIPSPPSVTPERIYCQIWNWDEGESLTSHFVIILPDNRMLTWKARMRAVRRAEILAAVAAAGLSAEASDAEAVGQSRSLVLTCRKPPAASR